MKAGVKTAIITLGEQGTVCLTGDKEMYFPTISVNAVDTTVAGDVFSGSFMKALAGGLDLEKAIVYASCAASPSVTRQGVTESVSDAGEVWDLFLKQQTMEEEKR
ncbi:hypothetical protein H9Q79_11425 [Wansuia hejianensis]|uniref:Carbohydrate kinase PfkB domain-containing protein n=1 Tax=Wansuia hejianensis TaxID=2763667 RepID=A0A7G9G9Q3_9FIRM|nr:hypothetical protein H9Q79_11425 [Wansuia hejianensis]